MLFAIDLIITIIIVLSAIAYLRNTNVDVNLSTGDKITKDIRTIKNIIVIYAALSLSGIVVLVSLCIFVFFGANLF